MKEATLSQMWENRAADLAIPKKIAVRNSACGEN